MEEDSGEDFGAKALNNATKRKFDYSFSSSDEEDDEEAKDSDDSVEEIKHALMIKKPLQQSALAASQME